MRLLEIIIAEADREGVEALLTEDKVIERWTFPSDQGQTVIKVLTDRENAKTLLAELEKKPGQRTIIYRVEGTSPKLEAPTGEEKEMLKIGKFFTISKEELYSHIDQPVKLSVNFILMVILSSFVAGIGILKDNVPIIIGAMVIAPFLGPNMSMAFGTTLGDWTIIRKSTVTGLVATALALAISMIWGWTASDVESIVRDPSIGYQDLLLALMCGFAGVIAVVSGPGAALVGVMVATALLPPLMRAGLLLGGGYFSDALNSFLIFSTNVVCVNLAGITTFYLAGIRPGRWWEKKKARRKTLVAFFAWILALVVLVVAILLFQEMSS